jgi:amidase/aspartyl-tRNA(Asn)/glutamyl-tRNA(Gln) amidotransferase subunit A
VSPPPHPAEQEIHRAGLLGLLRTRLEGREITSRELVEQAIARIANHSELNAVIALDADIALKAADEIDGWRRQGESLPSLAGIPALIKDVEDVKGFATTYGSLLHRDAPTAHADGSTAACLRQAGAVILGKTNLPEFAMESFTANRLWGVTHNPWRLGVSPGGSSGGSAAALSAGVAPIASGGDGGGSTRIPAALCGLVGLKPTSGIIGHAPARLPLDLSSSAPLAQTVVDLELLLGLLARPAAGDPTCVYGLLDSADNNLLPGQVLTAPRLVGSSEVDSRVAAAFEEATRRIAEAFGRVPEPLNLPVLPEAADDDWATIYAAEDAWAAGWDELDRQRELVDERVLPWIDAGRRTKLSDYLAARAARCEHVLALDDLLGDRNVLLSPTLTISSIPADGVMPGLEGQAVPMSYFNTAALNLTGHPALSVPAGEIGGIPFGVQIIGSRGSDGWLLRLAKRWEAVAQWPLVAPGYEVFLP